MVAVMDSRKVMSGKLTDAGGPRHHKCGFAPFCLLFIVLGLTPSASPVGRRTAFETCVSGDRLIAARSVSA